LLSKPHEYWRWLDHTTTYTDFKKEMWVNFWGGSVMKGSVGESSTPQARIVNAVALRNAVLCAECDVVSRQPA
jgi:hypothetical protein